MTNVLKSGLSTGANKRLAIWLAVLLPLLGCSGCSLTLSLYSGKASEGGAAMAFSLQSSAFKHNGPIPRKFTCQGSDVSPALAWSAAPAGTKSFALIADDPDAPAGIWVHWVLYDLPPGTMQLAENAPKTERLPGGGAQGTNDFKKVGYGGPCPPPGKPHRYFFKLYALDAMLNLKSGARKSDLEVAMKGHILGQSELIGTYKRE
jgi:Raf kinase inhibitor-like YbhB/YbcL family protein